MGSLSLLQGIFPTQESNRGLLHCRQILYQLSCQGSPKSLSLLSHLQLFATPWTVACQAPPSMGFSRQEYWSGVPLPSPILICIIYIIGKKQQCYFHCESESCSVVSDSVIPWTVGILQARILEWVAFPFSRGSSQPRDQTQVPHCRQILYQLSHQGSPRILEWVA